VDQALCDLVRTMSRQWFALPEAKKVGRVSPRPTPTPTAPALDNLTLSLRLERRTRDGQGLHWNCGKAEEEAGRSAWQAEIALRSCRQRGFRGYQALGANVTRYDGGFQRDVHEAIDLYKHFDEHHPHVVARLPLHGPNPWPRQLPGFTETIQQYARECNRLGADLMRGISLGLGLEEDYFAGASLSPEPPCSAGCGSRGGGCCDQDNEHVS